MTFATDIKLNQALGLRDDASALDRAFKFVKDQGVDVNEFIDEVKRRGAEANKTDPSDDYTAGQDPRITLTEITKGIAAERNISFTEALWVAQRSHVELYERVTRHVIERGSLTSRERKVPSR
jgi:hypothetical protein